MKNSKDERVQKLLDELEGLDADKYQIMQKLRQIVCDTYPQLNERVMYGGIMFTLDKDFGGIFASKNHVSFEFSNGYLMEDPHNHFEGTGKFRRHLKIKTIEDIDKKEVMFYIKQVILNDK